MATLQRELRRELERTVKDARRVADDGARKPIDRLGVGDAAPPAGLSPAGHSLRERLRAHGRQLGDRRDTRTGKQVTTKLVAECAYENWHRMLFARFLAENELLIEPESGLPINLDDCKEFARGQASDWLTVASLFAVRMLPQIFRPGDPVLDVSLPPETRSELEDLLKGLPSDIFKADDSLGWVYQFWQAERKERVNASETKIGADELPAVTQLFTEDYMVLFLLHNTLGAWWAGKVLAARPELATAAASEDELRAACAVGGIKWTYLRFVREGDGHWRPAAGTFPGWPKTAREITVLDPCMGSGHFLVFALPILVEFRMTEEGLTRRDAVDAVLHDNLFGLEIDPRCTQIAAFNLALAAWKLAGHHNLPKLQLACSGLALGVTKEEWLRLAERASPIPPDKDLFGKRENLFSDRVRSGFEALYDVFEKAPVLGSLIDLNRAGGTLLEAGYRELEPLLAPLLAAADSVELTEMAVTAQGLSKAAELLAKRFTLVATNVPYLGFKRQGPQLRAFCETQFPDSQAGLDTTFMERLLALLVDGGAVALVINQTWFFQPSSKLLRKSCLAAHSVGVMARLGTRAFETISGEVVNVACLTINDEPPGAAHCFSYLDAQQQPTPSAKSEQLLSGDFCLLSQHAILRNPGAVITHLNLDTNTLLSDAAISASGLKTGDRDRFNRAFWEVTFPNEEWEFYQVASKDGDNAFSGLTEIIFWQNGEGELAQLADSLKHLNHVVQNWRRGQVAWGRQGVAVSATGKIACHLYEGVRFDSAVTAIVPESTDHLPAIWAYCHSGEFESSIRSIDSKLSITTSALLNVPFDLRHWLEVANQEYPNGLPEPESDDPTQWLFHGRPEASDSPLQVAVARLVGYRWPTECDDAIQLCTRSRRLVTCCDELLGFVATDGIVCLTSSKGEASAADRLNGLLGAAYGSEWSAGKLDSLLAGVGFAGQRLDKWLRDGFFADHCEVFQNRPFVWHVWDGRQDGFHALVNYHRLAAPSGEGRLTLEKLIYTYLGDWIDRQRRDQQAGVDGSDARLAAATHLKAELEKILTTGEPPYDIFVRWKPLHEQPIGWEPDINDGVRINIRPFMLARPLGARARGACILRVTPKNIKWDKDRGKEPHREKEDFPWFWDWDEETIDFAGGESFDANRWNGLHYSTEFKNKARASAKSALASDKRRPAVATKEAK